MNQPDTSGTRADLKEQQERWDLKAKKAEYYYKVVISVFGSILAAVFVFYQFRQTEYREFTELQSTREKADSDLRATMFKTLFDAYFSAKDKDAQKKSSSSTDRLAKLHQEVLLSDVLARNFENIDIRPVFEDLDLRLSEVLGSAESSPGDRLAAFRQRDALRRVALGATSRQTASLAALQGTLVSEYSIIQLCQPRDGKSIEVDPPLDHMPAVILDTFSTINFAELRDGALLMELYTQMSELTAAPRTIDVTFFDMPSLENLPLKNGERVAFSLVSYASRDECERFPEAKDGRAQRYCADLVVQDEICAFGTLRLVILPHNFLGLRERPYQTDLAAGRFREPWYKLW